MKVTMIQHDRDLKHRSLFNLWKLVIIFGVALGIRDSFSSNVINKAEVDPSGRNPEILFESLRDDTKYHVVLLAGQSNMVGQGDIGALSVEDRQFPENIKYFNFGRGSGLQYEPSKFGPEVTIAHGLSSHFPGQHFVLVKYAVGASSLLDWSPRWTHKEAKVTGHPNFGPLYYNFVNWVKKITEGKDVRFVALLWMQGERDARIPEAGTNYYENLSSFVTHFRSDLAQPSLPVVIGQVNPPTSFHPAVNAVRSAQQLLALTSEDVYLIDTDDLEKRSDNVHYSTQGQLELGRRFSEILIRLLTCPGARY